MLGLILLLGVRSFTSPIPVDRVEYNTCYTEKGDVQFNQVIVWEWCPELRSYVVMDFVLVDEPPVLTKSSSNVTITFYHRRDGRFIRLRTREWVETKTSIDADPEVKNRNILPISERIKPW